MTGRTTYRVARYLDRCLEWTADSLNFALSSPARFIYGGLLVILSVLPVVTPLLIGYLCRCVRASADGRRSLPGFEQPAALYYDGIVVGLAALEYLAISLVVFGFTFAYGLKPLLESLGMLHYGLYVVLYLFLTIVLFGTLTINAWVHYSLTRDLWSIYNPVAAFSWVFMSPVMALKNLTITTLLFLVLLLPGCLLVTLPWVLFAGLAASAFQRAKAYAAVPGEGDPTYENTFGPWLALLPQPGKPRPPAVIVASGEPDFVFSLGTRKIRVPTWQAKIVADFALLRVESTIRSLRYSLSNGRRLLWGGLIVLVSFTLVPIPLLFGYLSRCIRESVGGGPAMPPFDSKRQMYLEGLQVCLILIEYLAISWVLFELTAPFISVPDVNLYSSGISSLVRLGNDNRLLPSFLHLFIFGMLFNNAWLLFIVSGSIWKALNPLSTVRWVLTYPEMIFNNMMSTGLAGLLLLAPGLILVTAPWVTFVGFVSNAYIRGESYRELARTGGIRKSWVAAAIARRVPAPLKAFR